MPAPVTTPIGLVLTKTAKTASRAFDLSLAEAGGSQPIWQILMSLKTARRANQRELAADVGIQGATLTHHLNGMETAGLVTRRRDPDNRRVHLVEITDEGEALFHRLAKAAIAHDKRLRAGFSEAELHLLAALLTRLGDNASTGPTGQSV
ncbi:MarR family winged helix-turn-helix transcriptional regulator [Amycolatopsis xylanica]|uniref:MarR family winged helix-turn-helix transcriptional regulator n=1 Tax=Amycolatopsis xylanica TaxID=589385 RepID=UPI000B8471A6|nr:MarR family winged helix-turn-helix transcriptional regulator [Amycolatopsis xylanica]